jgi:hypothetical protein
MNRDSKKFQEYLQKKKEYDNVAQNKNNFRFNNFNEGDKKVWRIIENPQKLNPYNVYYLVSNTVLFSDNLHANFSE